MNAVCDKVFVYGTLRSGFPLHRHLREGGARLLGRGTIRGLLYDLGNYPGAVRSKSPLDEIEGELYQLLSPDEQLALLDEIEEFYSEQPSASLYIRELSQVQLPTGRRLEAWVYFLPQKPPGARLISSNDYAHHNHSRN